MLAEIEGFVNWLRRRNAEARTWRDYEYDRKQFVAVVGDQPPATGTVWPFSPAMSKSGPRLVISPMTEYFA